MLGQLSDFLNTSAITDLSFLGSQEDGYPERLNQGGLGDPLLIYLVFADSIPSFLSPVI